MIEFLAQGIALGFSATVSPGPFQAYMLAQATAHGWKKTLPIAFAPLLSDGPIILVILLVLSQTPDWFLRLLNAAGGIFLLYLAYGAFRTFRTFSGENLSLAGEPQTPPQDHSVLRAALVNALAPGPWLFWSVLSGPILVRAWQISFADALAFLFGFYALLIGGNLAFIAFVASTRRLGPQVTRALNGIAAVGLFVFGVIQLWRGIIPN